MAFEPPDPRFQLAKAGSERGDLLVGGADVADCAVSGFLFSCGGHRLVSPVRRDQGVEVWSWLRSARLRSQVRFCAASQASFRSAKARAL